MEYQCHDKGLFIFGKTLAEEELFNFRESIMMREVRKLLNFKYGKESVLIECGYPGSLGCWKSY